MQNYHVYFFFKKKSIYGFQLLTELAYPLSLSLFPCVFFFSLSLLQSESFLSACFSLPPFTGNFLSFFTAPPISQCQGKGTLPRNSHSETELDSMVHVGLREVVCVCVCVCVCACVCFLPLLVADGPEDHMCSSV